ncbi:hypothetical protein AVEN_215789-1 [Araneus ventricosus]|uniref:Uncharacterized protein n=1 Tax=Araneus ventricosus TaxID=182803 RepID=A0A4Y2J7Q3_ARAVE|nr:hypothetical protein AVEN_215789-1 [Araneus ventricosus]
MQVAEISPPRHGKYADPSESRHKITVYYTVPNGSGQHVQVCSNTFKNIFALSARRLQTLQHLKKQGTLVYEDIRGKVPGCNANKKSTVMMIGTLFDVIFCHSLVSGHGFKPCDRDFSLIEKRKRNCKPMVPSDLDDVITSSRPSKPFKVVHMENEDFFDFAAIADGYISTTKLGISKLSQIRVSRSNPNEISNKEDFSDLLPFSTHKVFKKNKNHSKLPPPLKFPHLPTKNGISVEKKKDLLNLCDYLKGQKHRDLCWNIEMDTGNFNEDVV